MLLSSHSQIKWSRFGFEKNKHIYLELEDVQVLIITGNIWLKLCEPSPTPNPWMLFLFLDACMENSEQGKATDIRHESGVWKQKWRNLYNVSIRELLQRPWLRVYG